MSGTNWNQQRGWKETRWYISLVPWKCGTLLCWDETCPDTFASFYQARSVSEACVAAAYAEHKKAAKYGNLAANPCYLFMPIAIETTGEFGTQAFLKRGNAASVLGCLRPSQVDLF